MNLIEIKNLKTYFHTEGGLVKSVDDVSLSIPIGKTLGVVGESGCGKSVTAMSILQLVAHPGKIDALRIAKEYGYDPQYLEDQVLDWESDGIRVDAQDLEDYCANGDI